jgi:hypothetical protein
LYAKEEKKHYEAIDNDYENSDIHGEEEEEEIDLSEYIFEDKLIAMKDKN